MSDTDSTATIELTDHQRSYIDGLRAIVDLLEANPELISHHGEYFCCYATSREQLLELTRRAGGTWEKEVDEYFHFVQHFGPHRITIYTSRENVCERRVLGTRKVQRPAPDAPMVEVEEEIVAWVCPPSLLAEAGS